MWRNDSACTHANPMQPASNPMNPGLCPACLLLRHVTRDLSTNASVYVHPVDRPEPHMWICDTKKRKLGTSRPRVSA